MRALLTLKLYPYILLKQNEDSSQALFTVNAILHFSTKWDNNYKFPIDYHLI